MQDFVIKFVVNDLCQWFSPGTPVSSINKTDCNKTDCHDIVEILLKVALNTKTITPISLSTGTMSLSVARALDRTNSLQIWV